MFEIVTSHTNNISRMIIFIFLITIGLTMFGLNEINQTRINISNLLQLKSDVLVANLSLRNAAIADNEHDVGKELDKMLVTRASANNMYDLLTIGLKSDDRLILEELKKERMEYRKSQLDVIALVKKKKHDLQWEEMSYYCSLMDKYIQRVDFIIKNQNDYAVKIHNYIKVFLISVFSSLLVILVFIYSMFREGKSKCQKI